MFPELSLQGRQHAALMPYDLFSLPRRQQMSLQGNGMHLVAFSAWLMFVLSNVVRLDKVSQELFPITRTIFDPSEIDSSSSEDNAADDAPADDTAAVDVDAS